MCCISFHCFVVKLYSVFFSKQNTADEMLISDWSSDVCSSDLRLQVGEELDDGGSLGQQRAVVELQRRHVAIGVDGGEIDTGPGQVRRPADVHPLELERNPGFQGDDVRGQGTGSGGVVELHEGGSLDRKSTRLNSSH